jgi:hypothetical protein
VGGAESGEEEEGGTGRGGGRRAIKVRVVVVWVVSGLVGWVSWCDVGGVICVRGGGV